MKRKKRKIFLAGMIFFAAAGLLFFEIWCSYQNLQVREKQIVSDRLEDAVRVTVIADLHGFRFGEDNKELVEQVLQTEPDLIVMDGDMFNADGKDCEAVLSLIRRLSAVCPVYYAPGNHEFAYMESDPALPEKLAEAGAVYLEETYEDVVVNGQKLRIGGLYGYAFDQGTGKAEEMKESSPDIYRFLCEFQETDAYRILLSHRPDSFIFGEAANEWTIDLVISGHVHGGQVVLPFVGGLWAPDQGWFPKYDAGVFRLGTITLAITSGLGSQKEALPRFHNPPEILVLELMPE